MSQNVKIFNIYGNFSHFLGQAIITPLITTSHRAHDYWSFTRRPSTFRNNVNYPFRDGHHSSNNEVLSNNTPWRFTYINDIMEMRFTDMNDRIEMILLPLVQFPCSVSNPLGHCRLRCLTFFMEHSVQFPQLTVQAASTDGNHNINYSGCSEYRKILMTIQREIQIPYL